MPILYDEFGIESAIPAEKREPTAASSPRRRGPSPRRRRRRAYKRAIQLAYCQSNVAGDAALPYPRRVRPTRKAVGAVYADGSPKSSLEPVRAAMEAAGASEVGPCPVTATVSAAFTTGRRTISLRCERACTYRARLLRPPRRNAVTVVTGRAAAKRRAQVQLEPAEVTPGWYQLSVSFVDEARPGRPVERASARRSGAGLLAAALLAGCGGNDADRPTFLVGAVDDAARHEGPASSSCRRPASAPSGSRASGSRVSRRRPRRRLPSSAASSSAPATRGSSRRLPPWFIHDAADGRGASPVRRVRDRDHARRARDPRRDRRQRAQPESLRLPQFDADGGDVAAPAYLALLIEVYDAAKADPEIRIWGGALAPRGIDRPGTGRDTHSPTTFIRDLGAAYRVTGRDVLPMDGFAYHPYLRPARASCPTAPPTPRRTRS